MSKTSNNLDEALGRELEVELGGNVYKMSPLTMGDWKDFRGHVRGQRIRAALEGVGDTLDAEDKRSIVVQLSSAVITEFEQAQEFLTPEGISYMLWRSIRRNHPEVTWSQIEEVVADEDLDKLMALQEGLNVDLEEDGDEADPPEGETPSGGTIASPSSSGTTSSPSKTSST